MNGFLKSAGKSIKATAKGAADGLELLAKKSERECLKKDYESKKIEYNNFLKFKDDRAALEQVIKATTDNKTAFKIKKASADEKDDVVHQVYDEIITSLSSSEEILSEQKKKIDELSGTMTEERFITETKKFDEALEKINNKLQELRNK